MVVIKNLHYFLILLLISAFATLCHLGSPRYHGPLSEHFDGKKFVNSDKPINIGFFAFLKWQFSKKRKPWPSEVKWGDSVKPSVPAAGEVTLTFINHSSVLIQSSTSAILVDPVFAERVGPFSSLGPRRVHAPGISFDNLPKISVVAVTHDHYDHLDLATLEKLAKNPETEFVTGLGNGYWLKKAGAGRVLELDWWQEKKIGDVLLSFVPAHHWSGRSLGDRRNTLWGGFVLRVDNAAIYLAGDSGYTSLFKSIRERLGPFDLCVLPIGAYEPQWFMKNHHLNPEEALRVHQELGCPLSVPVHFGTFQISDEGWSDPIDALKAARKKHGVLEESFKVLAPGESVIVKRR